MRRAYLRGFIGFLLLALAVLGLGGCAGLHQGHLDRMAASGQAGAKADFTGVCVRVRGGVYHKYTYALILDRLACVKDGGKPVDYRQALIKDLQAVLPGARVVPWEEGCPQGARAVTVEFRAVYEGWGNRWGTNFVVRGPDMEERGYINPSMASHQDNPLLKVGTKGLSRNERWIARTLALIAAYTRAYLSPEGDPVRAWAERNPPKSRPCLLCRKTRWSKVLWSVKIAHPCPGDGGGEGKRAQK